VLRIVSFDARETYAATNRFVEGRRLAPRRFDGLPDQTRGLLRIRVAGKAEEGLVLLAGDLGHKRAHAYSRIAQCPCGGEAEGLPWI
jgi:hypothetical protein